MNILSIDPGKNGSLAFFENGKLLNCHLFPKIGKELDVRNLAPLIMHYQMLADIVAVEDVHAIYGCSAKSTFEFGKSRGILEGILCNRTIRWVKPLEWHKALTGTYEGSTKERALAWLIDTIKPLPSCMVKKSGKVNEQYVDSIAIGYFVMLSLEHDCKKA